MLVERLSGEIAPLNRKKSSYPESDYLYTGVVSPKGFEVNRIISYRNSFLPVVRGKFTPVPEGTAIHISMGLHPLVIGFLCYFCLMAFSVIGPLLVLMIDSLDIFTLRFLFVPTLVLVTFWFAFWFEVNRSSRELSQIILGSAESVSSQLKQAKSEAQLKTLAIFFAIGLAITIGFSLLFEETANPHQYFQMFGEKVDQCVNKPPTSSDCNYVLTRTNSGHPQANVLAISQDKQTMISGGRDKALMVWDLPSGKLRKTLQSDSGEILAVAIDPHGKIAATGSRDRMARLWDLKTGKRLALLKGHTNEVVAVALRPSDHRLVSGSSDGLIKIWDVDSGQLLATYGAKKQEETHIGPITLVNDQPGKLLSMSSDGSTALITDMNDRLAVRNLFTGKITHYLKDTVDSYNAVISPRGDYGIVQRHLYSTKTKDRRTKTGKISLWDLHTGKKVITKRITGSEVGNIPMAFHQGRVFGVTDGELYIWDLKKQATTANIKTDRFQNLVISEDGQTFAGITTGQDFGSSIIKIWSKK